MTYAEIDRMFFELLRLQAVAAGYLPDVTAFTGAGAQTRYAAAKEALRLTLPQKELIEVYGVGSSDARGEKLVSRFEVNRRTGSQGRIGGAGTTYMEVTGTDTQGNPTQFTKYGNPDKTKNLLYDIRLITDNTDMERIMMCMADSAFGELRGIQTISSAGAKTGNYVLVEFMGSQMMDLKGYMEHSFRYEVKDVMLGTDPIITENIVPLTTMQISLYLQPEENWNDGQNAFNNDFAGANFNNISPDIIITEP